MTRRSAIAHRAMSRVGADTTTTPNTDAEAKGLSAVLFSTTGLLIAGSLVGFWLVTR